MASVNSIQDGAGGRGHNVPPPQVNFLNYGRTPWATELKLSNFSNELFFKKYSVINCLRLPLVTIAMPKVDAFLINIFQLFSCKIFPELERFLLFPWRGVLNGICWAYYSARWRLGDSFRCALIFVLHWPSKEHHGRHGNTKGFIRYSFSYVFRIGYFFYFHQGEQGFCFVNSDS